LLFLIAFGVGIFISAAILAMVIETEKTIGITIILVFFVFGSILFTVAYVIAERRSGGAGILLGIELDSIAESLAFGTSVVGGAGLVITILIGIQNDSEGSASYREMVSKNSF
jgi:ABC-type xylose transport system permease subunit